MIEKMGQRLRDARMARGLSLEEAAHATKLRPDKITALENDDYARFASNSYAKGFLQIYSRFLRIDATTALDALDGTHSITVADYQYINAGVVPRESERVDSFSFAPKRKVSSVVPVVAIACLLALGLFGFQLYVKYQRIAGEPILGSGPSKATQDLLAETEKIRTAQDILPLFKDSAEMRNAPPPSATEKPPETEPPAIAAPETVAPPANDADRAFIVLEPAVAAVANEVLVEPIRKTWITVRRGDPTSVPVFEDYLYPNARPLKVKGERIYIEARDPDAIQIRKNGAPIAYQQPGIEIR